MTVRELIIQLLQFDLDADVYHDGDAFTYGAWQDVEEYNLGGRKGVLIS